MGEAGGLPSFYLKSTFYLPHGSRQKKAPTGNQCRAFLTHEVRLVGNDPDQAGERFLGRAIETLGIKARGFE